MCWTVRIRFPKGALIFLCAFVTSMVRGFTQLLVNLVWVGSFPRTEEANFSSPSSVEVYSVCNCTTNTLYNFMGAKFTFYLQLSGNTVYE